MKNKPFKSEVGATIDGATADAVVFYGGAVKAAGIVDGKGILEGYLVVFDTPGDPESRDLSGQYFTKNTYLGPRDGDGADGTFHHCLPIKGIEFAAEHLFAPIKTKRDEVGLFTQVVLDMSDKYEAAVYKAGAAGKLGFSSGTAEHMIRCAPDGEIKRWPIVEGALTPTPCEPRARARAMKALEAETAGEAIQAFATELKGLVEAPEETEEERNAAIIKGIQLDAILLRAQMLRNSAHV